MSDPVTNLEIEDVLSSIRRLISEDGVIQRKPVTKMTDRFVLTPALRVMDDAQPDLKTVTLKSDSAEKDIDAADSKGNAEESARNETSASAKGSEATWERVTEGGADGTSAFSSSRTALEERIAELEAAVSRTREEWEPDGSEPDAKEMPDRHIFAHAEPKQHESEAEATSVSETVDDDDPSVEDRARNTPSDAIISASESDDGDRQEHVASEPSDEIVVDEGALRELVADIVQRELQGALGERITRNVRRMVRREIQQAMALKDFK